MKNIYGLLFSAIFFLSLSLYLDNNSKEKYFKENNDNILALTTEITGSYTLPEDKSKEELAEIAKQDLQKKCNGELGAIYYTCKALATEDDWELTPVNQCPAANGGLAIKKDTTIHYKTNCTDDSVNSDDNDNNILNVISGNYKNSKNKNSNEIVDIIESSLKSQCSGTVSNINYKCKNDAGKVSEPKDSPINACDSISTITEVQKLKNKTILYTANCSGSINNDVNPIIDDTIDKHIGDNFCDDMAGTIRIAGYLLFVAKILVPFLIIIWASYDFYKASIDKNDDEIKKSTSKFFRRLLAGIIVFFIPTIVNLGLLFIENWGQYSGEYESCRTCLLEPFNCSVDN